ncbi:MAG TPA: 3',5'-cyclic-AMP phosphodiesterase [Gammaproteobacteria bacterium]|nr:3',5'-cyclic-AMP phosphodiesterase [Gammaproteobacteria bacterium]
MDSTPARPLVRLLHVTDTHLMSDPDGRYWGVHVRESFARVLAAARERHRPIAAWLLTGDLADDGSPEAYRALVAELDAQGVPAYLIPGNHDDSAMMARHAATRTTRVGGSAVIGAWHLVLLDSVVPGATHGELGRERLAALDAALAAHPRHPTLIAVHHHPLPVGSLWLDRLGLRDADTLFAVLARHPQVRAIVCGHIHQEFDREHAGIRVLGTPSTCAQFKPLSLPFLIEKDAAAGYRWLDLYADGTLVTGVERVGGRAP